MVVFLLIEHKIRLYFDRSIYYPLALIIKFLVALVTSDNSPALKDWANGNINNSILGGVL
ncbi:MAG: hypothetical protein FD167_1345 [bacterium]|nr:MAG: hypothetical protein FD167_1345 [bacterium]